MEWTAANVSVVHYCPDPPLASTRLTATLLMANLTRLPGIIFTNVSMDGTCGQFEVRKVRLRKAISLVVINIFSSACLSVALLRSIYTIQTF